MNEKMPRGVEDPIFGEPWDIEPEANHGILIGGMATYNEEYMAMAYKAAGDMLIEQALMSKDRSWEVAAPVLFLYRHTIELYLKWVTQPDKKNHNLEKLVKDANEIAMRRMGQSFPHWVKARLREFVNYDPGGTTFRYVDSKRPLPSDEYWIELSHLRQVMDVLTKGLEKLARLEQNVQKKPS